jgi:hypothetical protein
MMRLLRKELMANLTAEEELAEESTEEAAEAFLEQPPQAPWDETEEVETVDDDTE